MTNEARNAMASAEAIARSANFRLVETKSLLAGLMVDPGSGCSQVLKDIGVDRATLIGLVGAPPLPENLPNHHIVGLSADAKRVIDFAFSESSQAGSRLTGTEHLLVGLLRIDDDTTALLMKSGVTLQFVRPAVGRVVHAAEPRPEPLGCSPLRFFTNLL